MHNNKIIHLSDLHLTRSNSEPRMGFKLFNPLKGMNNNFRKIINNKIVKDADYILITGDITDKSYKIAWKHFGKIVQEAGVVEKLILVPGNHDVSQFDIKLKPHTKRYWSKKNIKKYIDGLKFAGFLYEDLPCILAEKNDLVIIGLNSNNTGSSNALTNAIGNISDEQFGMLEKLLKRYNDKPMKLVMTHHSPNIPGIRTAKKKGIKPVKFHNRITLQIPRKQRRQLRNICKEYGVNAILHGHLHSFEDRRVDNVRMIGVGASTKPTTANKNAIFSINQYKLYSNSKTLRRETIKI